jgi:hypothetical protein
VKKIRKVEKIEKLFELFGIQNFAENPPKSISPFFFNSSTNECIEFVDSVDLFKEIKYF